MTTLIESNKVYLIKNFISENFMLLKNLWCEKIALRVGMASATVFGLLLLAACGGDSGTSALSDNGTSSSEEIQSSSSSPKVESSSSVILSGDSHEESSSSSSVELFGAFRRGD